MVVGFPGPLPQATVMPGQLLQHVLRLLLLLPRLSLELHVSSCSCPQLGHTLFVFSVQSCHTVTAGLTLPCRCQHVF